jgi:hypothetical protein
MLKNWWDPFFVNCDENVNISSPSFPAIGTQNGWSEVR